MGPAFGGFDRLRVLGEAKGKTCNRAMSVVSSSQRTTGLMGGGAVCTSQNLLWPSCTQCCVS